MVTALVVAAFTALVLLTAVRGVLALSCDGWTWVCPTCGCDGHNTTEAAAAVDRDWHLAKHLTDHEATR